jgi:hypothetical protein
MADASPRARRFRLLARTIGWIALAGTLFVAIAGVAESCTGSMNDFVAANLGTKVEPAERARVVEHETRVATRTAAFGLAALIIAGALVVDLARGRKR